MRYFNETKNNLMKKKTLHIFGLAAIAVIGFTACNGLGKMVKKAPTVNYTVTPSPLEEHGDSVSVAISVKYPAKYFGKKVTLTFAPELKYGSGSKPLKQMTVLGEKALGNGPKIAYATGGSFSYTDKIPYTPELKTCSLMAKATGAVKSKSKVIPERMIAEGTITTPLLTKSDDRPIAGKDDLKDMPVNQQGQIFFQVSQSVIRPTEIKGKEMTDTKDFITKGLNRVRFVFNGMTISAYASPDGEQAMNGHLAEDRAKVTKKYYMDMFKEKDKKTKKEMLEAGTKDEFFSIKTTAEDWDGFKSLMEQSGIADKNIILGILSKYSDLDVREKEIKNLSATYNEIREQILPKLRRSIFTMNCTQKRRPDDEIAKLAATTPDSLNVEEILYAGTLTTDWNTKMAIYKNAARMFPNDWRSNNNLACSYIMLNKVNDADAALQAANKANANNPVIWNNMGIVARWKGDRKTAMEDYKKASGAGPEVSYNMGICEILNGNYAAAVSDFGSDCSFNAALAKLLSGDGSGASGALDCSKEKDSGWAYYLRAIIAARGGNKDGVTTNLKTAIQKDGSFREMAKTDLEFYKMRDDAGFKSAIQ